MDTMAKTYMLTVVDKIFEISDVVTIKLKQPAIKKIKYAAGQYITVIISINNRKYKRPYSLSSVFGLDATLNITIKAIPEGIVSNYLFNDLEIGQGLEIIEPMGSFTIKDYIKVDKIYLWSAGSGITPNMAILKHVLLQCDKKIRIHLIYSNKNIATTIFKDELAAIAQIYADRLNISYVHTRPDGLSSNVVYRKRIDDFYIKQIISQIQNYATAHYICGPMEMKNRIVDNLQKNGVRRDFIFSEDFYHILDETQLVDVINADANVNYSGQQMQFTVPRGKSILEACLDAGFDFPYSCQSGSCTLCKAELIGGTIKTIMEHQPDSPLLNNEFLTCCAYPTSTPVLFKV